MDLLYVTNIFVLDIVNTEYSCEDEKYRKRMDKPGIQQSSSKQSETIVATCCALDVAKLSRFIYM